MCVSKGCVVGFISTSEIPPRKVAEASNTVWILDVVLGGFTSLWIRR